MKRAMTAFRQDDAGDWMAVLDCGHRQHTRHKPPLVARPWVLSEAGRASKLGEFLDCVRCDNREIPVGHVAYKRTRSFDATTCPAGLRADHTTKAGVWGRIHVERGQLGYRIEAPYHCDEILTPERPGIVLPQVPHRVEPQDAVLFFVEFYRAE